MAGLPGPGRRGAAAAPPRLGAHARSSGALPGGHRSGRGLRGQVAPGSLGRAPRKKYRCSFFGLLAAVSARAAAAGRAGVGRKGGTREPRGSDLGAAPRRSRDSRLPARPPPRTAPRSPPPPRPTRSRAASLGEAAAGRPPRAGSSPARLGGPRAPQTATPVRRGAPRAPFGP